MKATILMKIAVVAMAAFGAYAFSGSAQPIPFKEFLIKDGEICLDIEARCSENGNEDCMISISNSVTPVYDLGCQQIVKHINTNLVDWK